jgi:hypothetical protein
MSNTRQAAEEVASQALRMIELFDQVFPKRIPNKCRCQIGGMSPDRIDFNRLLADLHVFYDAFLTPVQDCEVNQFLQLDKARGRAASLLADVGVRKLPVAEKLAEFRNSGKWITCKECSRIGDAIIALEQPSSWCLIHVDGSFNELSRCLDHDHKEIKSVAALQKEQPSG